MAQIGKFSPSFNGTVFFDKAGRLSDNGELDGADGEKVRAITNDFTVGLSDTPTNITYVGTTVTVTYSGGHGREDNSKIVVSGITSTSSADENYLNGQFVITKLDDNTFTYIATATPTGTLTFSNSNIKSGIFTFYSGFIVDPNYIDSDAIGSNPDAVLYNDGTIIGSTDNGTYVKYSNGEVDINMISPLLTCTGLNVAPIYFSGASFLTYPIELLIVEKTQLTAERGSAAGIGQIYAAQIDYSGISLTSIGVRLMGGSNYVGFVKASIKGRYK